MLKKALIHLTLLSVLFVLIGCKSRSNSSVIDQQSFPANPTIGTIPTPTPPVVGDDDDDDACPSTPTLSFVPDGGGASTTITAGDPTVTITATGSPAGGTYSTSNVVDSGTGGTYGTIGASTGVFTYSGSSAAGTAQINVTYAPPAPCTAVTTTYTVIVNAAAGGPTQASSSGVAQPIGAVTPVNDTITVSGGPTSITDLDVFVNIPHDFTGDLEVSLTAPSGSTTSLVAGEGGNAVDLFVGVIFDDEAGASITTITSPGGTFSPEGSLATFDGEDSNGIWTLTLVDTFTSLDDGCLVAWALLINNPTFVDPGGTGCGGGVTATLTFVPTSPASATVGGAIPVGITATGSPAGGTFTSSGESAGGTGGSFTFDGTFSSTGSFAFDASAATTAGTATVDITYTPVAPDLPVTMTYSVVVSGGGSGSTGDTPCDAIVASLGANAVDTTAMTDSGVETSGDCPATVGGLVANTSPDSWYSFTPGTTSDYTIGTCGAADYDSRIAIFDASTGCMSLATIECDDDSTGCGLAQEVTVTLSAGTLYLIRVDGFQTQSGTGTLSIVDTGGPACPATLTFSPLTVTVGDTDMPTITTMIDIDDGGTFSVGTFSAGGTGLSFVSIGTSGTLTFDASTATTAGTATIPVTYTPTTTGCSAVTATASVTVSSGASSSLSVLATSQGFTPTAIPDLGSISSTIVIAGGSPVISDVRVFFDASHTWDEDMDISLTSPTGTLVDLSSDNGGSADNYISTIFDDAAITSITAGSAPFTGSFMPETPLSALDGEASSGTWTLTVSDDSAALTGTLNEWGIALNGDTSIF